MVTLSDREKTQQKDTFSKIWPSVKKPLTHAHHCINFIMCKNMNFTKKLPKFSCFHLSGYKIPVLENLGATLDQFDTIDFSDNEIRKLDGFPLLRRLKTLLMNNNRIWYVSAATHWKKTSKTLKGHMMSLAAAEQFTNVNESGTSKLIHDFQETLNQNISGFIDKSTANQNMWR